jgi:hypothetical protein
VPEGKADRARQMILGILFGRQHFDELSTTLDHAPQSITIYFLRHRYLPLI